MEKNERKGERLQYCNQNWIVYINREGTRKIPYCDVLYIEQIGTILYVTRDEDVLEIPGRMNELSKILRVPFSQSHSYLMINFDRVYSMAKGKIVFDNKAEKYIGRDSFKATRKRFNQYLLGD